MGPTRTSTRKASGRLLMTLIVSVFTASLILAAPPHRCPSEEWQMSMLNDGEDYCRHAP